jgi:hypothetical protein
MIFAVTWTVSSFTASGVSAIACTDGGAPILVGALSGLGTVAAQGLVSVSGSGDHALVCTATDIPGNAGAGPGSVNAGTVRIDIVPPTVNITTGDQRIYVLNGAERQLASRIRRRSGMGSCVGKPRRARSIQHGEDVHGDVIDVAATRQRSVLPGGLCSR